MDQENENVWNTDESARHIQRLGQVEQDVVRLMELAGECMSLLALPLTDSTEEAQTLPKGPERSAVFATNAEQYFDTLNAIQTGIRESLARVRGARIPAGALKAPEGRMASHNLGSAIPRNEDSGEVVLGFQERKIERNAWVGLAKALQKVNDSSVE